MEENTPETFVEYEPNQLASRGKRLAAAVVDVFIFFPLVLLIAQPLGLINISDPAKMQGFNLDQTMQLFIIGQVLFLLVQGYLLHTQGPTIGRRIAWNRSIIFRSLSHLQLNRPDSNHWSLY
jgi:uncharacterized RDD family membrane protein YckC